MDIKFKIIVTLVMLWGVTHICAMPGSPFAEWGERMFKSYGLFIVAIALTCLFPVVLIFIYYIWTL